MQAAILVLSLFIGFQAQATVTDIQTVVDVTSGEQLYACNARLRHATTGNEQECFRLSNGEACYPESIKPGDGPCVCNSKNGYGDLIAAETKQGRVQSVAGGAEWASLVPSAEAFGNQLRSIDFALGSESLGAEYAVTFCYLGPKQIMKKKSHPGEQDQDLSEGKYRLDVSLAGINYGNALEEVGFQYSCDQRLVGNYGQPRDPNNLVPPTGQVENDTSYQTTFFGGVGNKVQFVRNELILNQTPSQVPRFCIFEFQFKEKSGTKLKRDPKQISGDFTGRIRICKQGSCP